MNEKAIECYDCIYTNRTVTFDRIDTV